MKNKTIRWISPAELDGIIAQIANDGGTALVLLGSNAYISDDTKDRPAFWQITKHIYQLTEEIKQIDVFCKKLSVLSHLTSLDLRNNHIGDAGVEHLSRLSNLTSLNLWHNQIGKAGAKHISRLSKLTSLGLGDNHSVKKPTNPR